MDIEQDLLKKYYRFIKAKSIFKEVLTILPDTPQSFYDFPTIIFREQSNSDTTSGKTTNRIEYADYVIYQVDIYTKNVILDGKEYAAKDVISELKILTHNFFRNLGFNRSSSTRGEYLDLNVKRQVMTFIATIQSWNKYII